jgi:hypothetical protein
MSERKNYISPSLNNDRERNEKIEDNLNSNKPQQADNFGTVNKDYRTNLSTHQNYASNKYILNQNFNRANN